MTVKKAVAKKAPVKKAVVKKTVAKKIIAQEIIPADAQKALEEDYANAWLENEYQKPDISDILKDIKLTIILSVIGFFTAFFIVSSLHR